MTPIAEISAALVAGAMLGAIFRAVGIPCPAPPSVAGIMGIIGVAAGYWMVSEWMK